MIRTLTWTPEGVSFIDQTKLPTEEVYVLCRTYEEVAAAIKTMVVRGAPAIGVAAVSEEMERVSRVITATRPTAVNLFWAAERMRRVFDDSARSGASVDDLKQR